MRLDITVCVCNCMYSIAHIWYIYIEREGEKEIDLYICRMIVPSYMQIELDILRAWEHHSLGAQKTVRKLFGEALKGRFLHVLTILLGSDEASGIDLVIAPKPLAEWSKVNRLELSPKVLLCQTTFTWVSYMQKMRSFLFKGPAAEVSVHALLLSELNQTVSVMPQYLSW